MWKCMSGVEKVAKRLGYPLRLPLANEVAMPEYDWGEKFASGVCSWTFWKLRPKVAQSDARRRRRTLEDFRGVTGA